MRDISLFNLPFELWTVGFPIVKVGWTSVLASVSFVLVSFESIPFASTKILGGYVDGDIEGKGLCIERLIVMAVDKRSNAYP